MRASFALIALIAMTMLPTATLAQSDEAVFWQSISNSADGAEFCAYLEAFPNGKFVALAKLRAKKLGASCGIGAQSAPVASPAPARQPAKPSANPLPNYSIRVSREEMERTHNALLDAEPKIVGFTNEFPRSKIKPCFDCADILLVCKSATVAGAHQLKNMSIASLDYETAKSAFIWLKDQSNNVFESDPQKIVDVVSNGGADCAAFGGGPLRYGEHYREALLNGLRDRMGSPSSTSTPTSAAASGSIELRDQLMYVTKNANVRAAPSTNGAKLFVMNKGEQVQVTGKIQGQDWYQIKLGGADRGYIYGTLLGDQAPGHATQPVATANSSASSSTSPKTRDDLAGWDQFMLEVEMFPASRWAGRDDDGCQVTLSFEHWKVDPKYTWTRDCNGQTETETKVYALSPGTNWLNLPEDANFVELCRLFANDAGDVKLVDCKYEGVYRNASRADLIIDAMEHYKAGAPEREAERKKRDAESKRLRAETARKDAIQAKTPYGKRLAQLNGKPFGTAPIPASGQGIVVCSSHIFSDPEKSSGKFPEKSVMNFNAAQMELMESELSNYGITDFDLGKLPWMDRNGYVLFDVFNGVIFYDRNIQRRTHPTGGGDIVVGEMINSSLKEYIFDATRHVNCEVMIERKTCPNPKDQKGIFSIPCD